jgi:hypothetical protein
LPVQPTDAPISAPQDSAPGQDKKNAESASSTDGTGRAKGHDK